MGKRILTYDFVTQISKQYASRFEFQKGDKAAYNKALKEGWIDSYQWLGVPVRKVNDSLKKAHVVYAYLDEDNKVAYIGRTIDIRQRHYQHNKLSHKYKKYDAVKRYFMSIGYLGKLPDPVILETGLTLVESQEKEGFYVNEYKANGWHILNTGKTGANISSTGSYIIKWTYENCRKIALSCKTRQEFKKLNASAYLTAAKNKWIDEWLPVSPTYHKANHTWTKDMCYDIAIKYASLKEFSEKESVAYYAAKRHGWLKEYAWLTKKKREDITKEEIVLKARNFEHSSDFKREHPSLYHRARLMGILNDLGFKPKDTSKWNYETCKAEASKYKSQIEFRKACPVAYNKSHKNGWINDWLPKTVIVRSDEELLKEAKQYKNINDLRKKNDSLYCLILKRGLLEHTGLPYLRKQWTKEKIKEESTHYLTRNAFKEGNMSAYDYARRHKMLDELFPIKSINYGI